MWRVALKAGLAVGVKQTSPRLEGNVRQFEIRRKSTRPRPEDTFRIIRQLRTTLTDPMAFFTPKCAEVHMAIGPSRCRCCLPVLANRWKNEDDSDQDGKRQ